MNVILSDGTPGVIDDGLSNDGVANQIQQLEAAKAAASKPSPKSASPSPQSASSPAAQGGGGWLDWFRNQPTIDFSQPPQAKTWLDAPAAAAERGANAVVGSAIAPAASAVSDTAGGALERR